MTKSPFVIAISGDPASGKTSAINALSDKYEKEGFFIGERMEGKCVIRLASGQMFRDIANNAGITLQELNAFAKRDGNTLKELKEKTGAPAFFDKLSPEILTKSVDSFVDEYILNYVEMLKAKYIDKKDVIIIVDSRIAGLLMKNSGKEVMNIRFCAKPEVSAERLLMDAENRRGEINISSSKKEEAYKAAYESIVLRTHVERTRFIKTYSKNPLVPGENDKVDLQNYDNYDLIIDTSGTTIEKELEVLHTCIERARTELPYAKLWCSTKYIYPGNIPSANRISMADNGFFALKVDGQYYAMNSLDYIGNSNKKGYEIEKKLGNEGGYELIPLYILAKDTQLGIMGKESFQANVYVKEKITPKLIKEFEKTYNFKYPERGGVKLNKKKLEINR